MKHEWTYELNHYPDGWAWYAFCDGYREGWGEALTKRGALRAARKVKRRRESERARLAAIRDVSVERGLL